MKHIQMHRCLIVVLVCSLVNLALTENKNHDNQGFQGSNQVQNEAEKQQFLLQEKFKNQQQQNLDEWIIQQIKHNEQYQDVLPYESATFLLQPNIPQIYRIPVSISQQMMIKVSLFSISKQGLLVLPQDPAQDNYAQVSTFEEAHGPQYVQGKVYIQRAIELKFRGTHKYLKFINKANQPLIAILDIEQLQLMMEIQVSDDQFALTNKKIQTILKQTKETQVNRQHLYKWQWGFYQKLWRHQSDMLGFTGAQLLVIVATSIVQMYCIKNLINDELII